MIKAFFGDMSNSVYNTSLYFNYNYDDAWLDDDLVKEMVLDIDKSEVLDRNCIKSPVLGLINPTSLSGGVKTLILILKERDAVFNASQCGNNCAKWLLRIAEESNDDILINLHHIMNFGDEPFDLCVANTNQIVHSMRELLPIAHNILFDLGDS